MQLKNKVSLMVVVLLWIGSLGLAQTYSQFAVGGGFEVVLMISNDSDEEWTGEILIRKGAAQDWDTFLAVNGEVFLEGTGSVSVSIPPRSDFRSLAEVSLESEKVSPSQASSLRSAGKLEGSIPALPYITLRAILLRLS